MNSVLNLLSRDDAHSSMHTEGTLQLEEVLGDLERLRSKGEAYTRSALLETSQGLPAGYAEVVARQIANEVEIQVDGFGNGRINVGTNRNEKRHTFFFDEGQAARLRKVTQPCSSRINLSNNGRLPRNVKLLFVNVKSPSYPMITAPLGIITLGGYLRQVFGAQVNTEYLDMQLEDFKALAGLLMEFQPEIIGLSVKTGGVREMREILDEITALDLRPPPLIVLGNAIPTYASEHVLREFRDVVCVIGRGEPAIRTLVENVAFDRRTGHLFEVPNSSFLSGSTIHQIDGVPFGLSDLGIADWAALFRRYHVTSYQEVWVEASRGCPQKRGGVGCSFCAIMPNNDSQDWLARPSKRVCQEIEFLSQTGVKHIRFADEEFMAGQTIEALRFATEMKVLKEALCSKGLRMPTFDFAIRVDDVYKRGLKERQQMDIGDGTLMNNNEVRRLALATFKDAGLTQVYLGLESGSFNQLKRMYKAAIPEDNLKAIEILRTLDLQIAGGWIMIDPLMEGPDDLKENIAFLETSRLIPDSLSDDFVTNPINRMRVLEGSPMVDILRKRGLLGARKESLIEYDFGYQDSRIAEIDRILNQWESEFLPFVYALKSRVAVASLEQDDNSRLAKYYFSLKRLDFEFFKELVDSVFSGAESCSANILTKFRLSRTKIICRVLDDLAKNLIDDASGTLHAGLARVGAS